MKEKPQSSSLASIKYHTAAAGILPTPMPESSPALLRVFADGCCCVVAGGQWMMTKRGAEMYQLWLS